MASPTAILTGVPSASKALRLNSNAAACLRAISEHQARYGWAPSLREIINATGIRSTSHVAYWLRFLAEYDYIIRGAGSRQLALTELGNDYIRQDEEGEEA